MVLAIVCTLQSAAWAGTSDTPLVYLADIDPSILQDIRYATDNNFMGRAVRGYERPRAMLAPEAAAALAEAQQAALKQGLSLLVYDAYRPQRAVDHFVEWAGDLSDTVAKAAYYPDVPKALLFERGYIARRSGHSRGSTVDLTLARRGRPLDMGTSYDFFGPQSHTDSPAVDNTARKNRELLREIMEAAGFQNYAKEWWHYTLRDEP
jgi:D-alanyl-D-alanine dipeptidase